MAEKGVCPSYLSDLLASLFSAIFDTIADAELAYSKEKMSECQMPKPGSQHDAMKTISYQENN